MQITEVRIKLCEHNAERLLAFCSVTFDNSFVVRDLKIIEGTRGMFVAMPSRKLMDRCGCGCKNHLRARFCNGCGRKLDEHRAGRDMDGRTKLHADIAHPIHGPAREQIQGAIVHAFQTECIKAKQPGYVCRYDDHDEYDDSPLSYGGMVQEMTAPLGYKAHGPHGAPRGTHMDREPVEHFGAGVR